jgi:hypothetical protein
MKKCFSFALKQPSLQIIKNLHLLKDEALGVNLIKLLLLVIAPV